jgi:hypothetical protein
MVDGSWWETLLTIYRPTSATCQLSPFLCTAKVIELNNTGVTKLPVVL